MYYQTVMQCAENVRVMEGWLDRAIQHAAVKKFDVDLLVWSRLAPDMLPLRFQITSASHYVLEGASRLAGRPAPRFANDERTIEELRTRIQRTVRFVRGVPETAYTGVEERRHTVPWREAQVIAGPDYLRQIIVPNVYFHITTAYAILRHNGVDLGKMDYLGEMKFFDPATV